MATGIEVPPQVGAAADPSVVDVVVVDALGSVLVGTEVVDVSPCDVVVVVLVDFAPLTGGTVVVVVVVVEVSGAFCFSLVHDAVKPTIATIATPPATAARRR